MQNVQRHRDQGRVRSSVFSEVLLQECLGIHLPDLTQSLLHSRPRWAELQDGNVRVCTMGALTAENEDARFRGGLHQLLYYCDCGDFENRGHGFGGLAL